MKQRLLIFALLFSFIFSRGFSQAKAKDRVIAAGEMLTVNLFLFDLNTLFLESDPPQVSFEIFLENLKTPWIWDFSSFKRNQFFHPYIGATYFNSGRANNLGFYESFLLSAAGSFIWETYLEGPVSSANDFITTPLAGSIVGEIMHRLYFCAYDVSPFLSFFVSPVDSINSFLRDKNAARPEGKIYSMDVFVSSGFNSSSFNFDSSSYSSYTNFYYPSLGFGLDIVYQNPYGHKTKEPLDQFNFKTGTYGAIDYGLLYMKADGTLYSWPYYLNNEDNKHSLGISFDYDVYKATDINLSTSSIGFTDKHLLNFSDKELTSNLELNFVYLAASDNYFLLKQDSSITKSAKQPVYTYKLGPELKFDLAFKSQNYKIYTSLVLDYLFTIPGSTIDSKFISDAFIFMVEAGFEHKITGNFYLGINDFLYFKNDINKKDEICSTVQASNFVLLYAKYYFN